MFVRRLLPVLVVAQSAVQGCAMLLSLDEFDSGEDSDDGEHGPLVLNFIFRQSVQACMEANR